MDGKESCENCPAIKQTALAVETVSLQTRRAQQDIESVERTQRDRDEEHEAMIQNLSTDVNKMREEFDELKQDVKDEIQAIRNEIPGLFDQAVNKLLARIAKWLLFGFGFILLVIVVCFTKPLVEKGLKNLTEWVEKYEVQK